MRRSDAFLFGVTLCVALNCGSYFVRSDAPHVTDWGRGGGVEEIGFPFVVVGESSRGIVAYQVRSWMGLLGNLLVSIVVGITVRFFMVDRLPPLWPGYAREHRFSLRGMLVVFALFSLLLGLSGVSSFYALLVRNMICFVGPLLVYGWCCIRRRISWSRLAVAASTLAGFTLLIDLRHGTWPVEMHEVLRAILPLPLDSWDTSDALNIHFARHLLGLLVVRAAVPPLGLLSLLVIAPVAPALVRECRRLIVAALVHLARQDDREAEPSREES